MHAFSNKKKVRGWKRRVQAVESWREAYRRLDHARMDELGYDYVKLWIDPWYRLVKRNPPMWYRRVVLRAAFDIYNSWHEALCSRDEPFYLRLWLYDPNFSKLQVVAAAGERMAWYEELFEPDPELPAYPPVEYGQGDCGYDLAAYEWEPCMDTDLVTLDGVELRRRELERIKKRTVSMHVSEGGTAWRLVRAGNVWLGSRPGPGVD